MKYEEMLSKHNLTIDTVSPGLKKKISELIQVESDITEVKGLLSSDSLSVSKRGKMEKDLAKAEKLLPDQDQRIAASIEKWFLNKDKYAEKGKQLQAARAAKKGNTAASSQQSTPSKEVDKKPENKPQQPTPQPGSNTKRRGAWGWIGFSFLVLVGAMVGVSIHNKSTK